MSSTLLLALLSAATVSGLPEPSDDRAIELRLDNAILDITVETDIDISMQRKDDGPALEVIESTGRLVLQRVDASDSASRLQLILELPSGRPLTVTGSELDLTIRHRLTASDLEEISLDGLQAKLDDESDGDEDLDEDEDEGEDEDEDQDDDGDRDSLEKREALAQLAVVSAASAANLITVRATDSKIDLIDVGAIDIASRSSRVSILGGEGTIKAGSEHGFLRIADRNGQVDLKTSDDSVEIDGASGALTIRATGGEIETTGGAGQLQVHLDNAFFRSVAQRGAVILDARNSTIELIGRSDIVGRTQLRIEDSHTIIDSLRGGMHWVGFGGELKASRSNVQGKIEMSRGAVLDLETISGPLSLDLATHSEARITGLERALSATVRESALDVINASSVQLEAEGDSRIALSEIARIGRISLTDSSAELDLSGLLHDPSLKLSGTTSAHISISSPCLVQMQGQAAAFDQQIEVYGCEVRAPGQPTHGTRHRIQYPGGVRILRIEADSSTSVNVEGRL